VLRRLQTETIWIPLTYFQLWLVRLIGFLPELDVCGVCGRSLVEDRAFYHALADGVMCLEHKRLASSELTLDSRRMAARMFRARVEEFETPAGANGNGARSLHADLRKFLLRILERHLEKKLITATMLEKL